MVGHEEYMGEMGNGNELVSDNLNSGTVGRNGVNRRAIDEVG
jgi:hypothetical protein